MCVKQGTFEGVKRVDLDDTLILDLPPNRDEALTFRRSSKTGGSEYTYRASTFPDKKLSGPSSFNLTV